MKNEEGYSSTNANKYSCREPFVVKKLEVFFRTIVAVLSDLKSNAVLSLGCGEGLELRYLHDMGWSGAARYYGLDLSRGAIRESRNVLDGIPFNAVCGDVGSLPLRLDRFDLIICLELLEHVQNPSYVLEEVFSRYRGHCVFSVPNEPLYRLTRMLRFRQNIRHFGNHPEHVNHWSASGFTRLLEKHATILRVEKPFPWTVVLCKGRE